ncbi:MAG TPA: hypothetical protein VFE52_07055, partial [Devosia sp.]|nr:hypothetical protein [Devosia sp.]
MVVPSANSPSGTAASAPDRRSRPIAVYLFVLALVALVPAFAFSAILLQRNNEAQENVVETLITGSARSIMQAVDREVFANISTLKVLATTKTLESGDLRAFYDQIRTALEGTNTYVHALNADYMSLFTTRAEFGSPSVRTNDVASAQKAFETRDVVISGLVVGSFSGANIYNVLFPVFTGELAPLILAISREASTLETALLSDKLPDGWNVAMIDATGTIISASAG